MSRHLTAIRGGLVDDPTIDPAYWQHPVHGAKAMEQKARETVAQAFDGDPHGPRWALTVLALAVDGNTKAIAQHRDALEILAAHFSKAAPRMVTIPESLRDEFHEWAATQDAASPFGIPRPDGGAA